MIKRIYKFSTTLLASALLFGCSSDNSPKVQQVSLLDNKVINSNAAYIPLQCYTKTRGQDDKIHNPCFSCHTQGKTPNFLDDSEFQLLYDFRDSTKQNPWKNAFKDRTQKVKEISDEEITAYIRKSNYFNANGQLTLSQKLSSNLPAEWDFNKNGKWEGYIPDIYFNFDNQGFDKKPDGSDSGWRAFAYYPFLGTFWPTNGSSNDVLIRLPEEFQQDNNGVYNRKIYQLNLAVLEAMIREKNIPIDITDETYYQVDLNKNGKLDTANEVVYDWAPLNRKFMSYVGKAKQLFDKGELKMAAGLYPKGTEFAHTVRYIDLMVNGQLSLAPRIKELRYAKKLAWNNYSQLRNAVMAEGKEAIAFPDRLRSIKGNPELGVGNSIGWIYQGFIEDVSGNLRPQSYEESLTCVGCHSGIGATTDSSFAFPRRLGSQHFQKGWFHWSQKNIHSIPEPKWADGTYEYSQYLIQNHSGNEFRTNSEVLHKFFDDEGKLKQPQIEVLNKDIGHLLTPSKARALELNKAYKVIVDEQSFIYGRDPHIKPLENVWKKIPDNELTGIESAVIRQAVQ